VPVQKAAWLRKSFDGYEVTLVKDATADYSHEEMHAALDINIPNYASAIVTTNEVADSISSL
jgi:ureidoacrylate peracid hydrolase